MMIKFTQSEKLLVARANRILKAARQRVAEGGKYSKEMEGAVDFASKKVRAVMGSRAESLKLSGASITKKERILETARGIVESKKLTVSGIQATNKKAISRFYGKSYNEITQKEKDVFYALRDSGTLHKISEIAYLHSSIAGAAIQIAPNLSAEKIVEALTDYVNNKIIPGVSKEGTDGEIKGVRESVAFYDYLYERYIKQDKTRPHGGNT